MRKKYPKIKVCLLGASFKSGNMGVSALAASFVKIIDKILPNSEIIFVNSEFSNQTQYVQLKDKIKKIKVDNYRLSFKNGSKRNIIIILVLACLVKVVPTKKLKDSIIKKNPCLSTLYESQLICQIRGGDSFSDIYGIKRFLYGIAPSIATLLLNKEHILLPQTYGPYNSTIAGIIAKIIINKSVHIVSRDRSGIDTVKKLIYKNKDTNKVSFCPDIAFVLDTIKPSNIYETLGVFISDESPLIGFNISGLLYHGGYTKNNMFNLNFDYKQFVYEASKKILDSTNANILFVPHTWGTSDDNDIESDPFACLDVANKLSLEFQKRAFVVDIKNNFYDQSELKGIISLCDFFIGSRMHSCIAALSNKIPTVSIAYSKKFIGVFNSINAGSYVADARFLNKKETINIIMETFNKRNKIKNDLNIIIPDIKKDIYDTFKLLSINFADR